MPGEWGMRYYCLIGILAGVTALLTVATTYTDC